MDSMSCDVEAMAGVDKTLDDAPDTEADTTDGRGNITSAHVSDSQSDEQIPNSTTPLKNRKHPWTLTHSFFALMGGFVLQDPHDTPVDRYLPAWQGNGVLAKQGVRMLISVAPELIPDIPVDELLDRGKADGLAKMILAWQVLWFCLSCLNRAVQHLPLSLLEVTTIAHALCALLTYAAWWKKPKDVGRPIVIGMQSDPDRQRTREVGAWLSTLSFTDRSLLFNGILLYHHSEFTTVIQVGQSPDAWPNWLHHGRDQWKAHNASDGPSDPSDPPQASPEVLLRPYLSSKAVRRTSRLTTLKLKYIFYWRPLPWYVEGSAIDEAEEQATMKRRLLLSSVLPEKVQDFVRSTYGDGNPLVVPVATIQAATHSARTAKSRTGIGLALLPAVYGFPHLLGLGTTFPTDVERSLWRWTTVAIMALGVWTFCIVYMLFSFGTCLWRRSRRHGFLYRLSHGENPWLKFDAHNMMPFGALLQRFGKTVAFFNLLIYFIGSMYLVVESFRQLFALPPESFTLPSWGDYWPHFG